LKCYVDYTPVDFWNRQSLRICGPRKPFFLSFFKYFFGDWLHWQSDALITRLDLIRSRLDLNLSFFYFNFCSFNVLFMRFCTDTFMNTNCIFLSTHEGPTEKCGSTCSAILPRRSIWINSYRLHSDSRFKQ
jgi:hypothetical protein